MTEILSIDGSKIDQVLNDIAKLIFKQITEIRNRIGDVVLQARLKKSLAVKS